MRNKGNRTGTESLETAHTSNLKDKLKNNKKTHKNYMYFAYRFYVF